MGKQGSNTVQLNAAQIVDWTGSAPVGATLDKVYIGPDPDGLGGIQIATATVTSEPGRGLLDKLFKLRKGSRAISLVVVASDGARTWLYGTDPRAEIITLTTSQAERQLQSVLDEPGSTAAFNRVATLRRQVDSGGVGWANNGLFAKHHLEHNVPSRSDWATRGERSKPLLGLRGQRLIEALGFRTTPGTGGTLILAPAYGDSGIPRAVAVLLDESEHFDAKSSRYQLTPIAFGLAVAQRQEIPWVVGLRKEAIRLYPGKDGVGVGQKGQVETFFEIDLSAIDDSQAALLTLVFSAEALAKDGTTDELLRDSARYATALGVRLRQRIYEEVVPPIAKAVSERLPSIGLKVDAEGLQTAYKLTLRILFRLLFQAYAEDRGLLPSGRNEGYDANSLKTIARRNLEIEETDFGDAASIWLDLVQVWNAIDQGNKQWQVPAYNGGLFAAEVTRSEEGALLAHLSLPDSVLGPALQHLLVDATNEGVPGLVDFRALSVREFGTIYEGLLESSLSIADADLTTDREGAWVPAGLGDVVEAVKGSVYFHGASGERKATGSYFTPKVVVDHLIERSIKPALEAHLDKIAARLAKGEVVSRTEFFDFRVADLAMGSGHFLVAAVDKIEALMRTFLTEHDIPDVRQELLTIAGVARDALGTDEVAKSEVEEIGLLRRQVARRCIYGLDINPLAVELARLALWIHTFVPGLPMSNLDHGLACANSLTGIGTIDEAIDSLVGAKYGRSSKKSTTVQADGLDFKVEDGRQESGHQLMVRKAVTDYLGASLPLLADVANASEAGKAEVQRAADLLAEAKAAAAPASRIFDAAVAVRLGEWSVSITKEEHVTRLVESTEPTDLVARLNPAHLPVLFPEVFVRDNPGFDVLVGNPPWEELTIEELKFWAFVRPGLSGLPTAQREAEMADLRSRYPDLVAEWEQRRVALEGMRLALLRGPFPGMGTGDPDLYKAFAWRNWHLLRRNGRLGIVLPLSPWVTQGSSEWRREVIASGLVEVGFFSNIGGWVFPEVNPGYRVTTTVVTRRPDAAVIRVSGPFRNLVELEGAEVSTEISSAAVLASDPDACLPTFSGPRDVALWSHLIKFPGLGDGRLSGSRTDIRSAPATEIHATNDGKKDGGPQLFLTEIPNTPVYNHLNVGEFFFDPDAGEFAQANLEEVATWAQGLRSRTHTRRDSPFSIRPVSWSQDKSTLPLLHPRIAIRDVVHASNPRKVWAALIPPGMPLTNKAPYLVFDDDDVMRQAFLLGILNSGVVDWFGHLRVNLNLNFFILYSLPVPWFRRDDMADRRISALAAGLAQNPRYDYGDWASLGAPITGDIGRINAKAELDALVAFRFEVPDEMLPLIFDGENPTRSNLEDVRTKINAWKEAT